jgi:hypothetical protein
LWVGRADSRGFCGSGGAEMALLELVVREERHHEKKARAAAEKQKGGKKAKPEKKAGDKGKARDESEK